MMNALSLEGESGSGLAGRLKWRKALGGGAALLWVCSYEGLVQSNTTEVEPFVWKMFSECIISYNFYQR